MKSLFIFISLSKTLITHPGRGGRREVQDVVWFGRHNKAGFDTAVQLLQKEERRKKKDERNAARLDLIGKGGYKEVDGLSRVGSN